MFETFLAALIFLPAWSLHFWQAWLYLGMFTLASLLLNLYFLRRDPALIARRLEAGPKAEPEKSQKVIQSVAAVFACALYVLPGVDHRLRWSDVPAGLVVAADLIFAIGFTVIFFVFRANSYAASVVKVEAGQRVVCTGPYAVVRHPMYAGAMLSLLATPVALGSWWTLLAAAALCAVIVVRLLDEERYLAVHLPGYDDYRRQTRCRLIPFVW